MNELLHADRCIILDGGLGTMLQAAGLPPGAKPELVALEQPDKLLAIHRAYAEAGADILCADTFGANAKKLADSGYSVEQVISAAVNVARKAGDVTGSKVALDIGPLGELLEPIGTLSFEEAYSLFAQVVQAGERAGADLIMIETMTDLYEAKAALLAAKENSDLPVMVSMTFEVGGRTFAGASVQAMAATLSPLGAAALGINCSLGPKEILPLAGQLCECSDLPIFIKPNAGLPDPSTGHYDLNPEEFFLQLQPGLEMGISMVGGCCGTTPETIRLLASYFKGRCPVSRTRKRQAVVCSGSRVVCVSDVHAIGERINPTGKRRLQEALRSGDLGYVQAQAVAQQQDGAAILDVNVGAPDVDEVSLLPRVVQAVQAVSDLPLQLDSANPFALEAALRIYNGKAIVNSTSGEKEKLEAILPLCKKYGAAVVGLTLDEEGIPADAEGRFAIAERILQASLAAGLPKEDVYIDCLTLSASAEIDSGFETLRTVEMVKRQLGLKTVLGISNISFGLPNRPLLNRTFLTMALYAGLDLPIINPAAEGMMDAVVAFSLLMGRDKDCRNFVERFGHAQPQPVLNGDMEGDMPLDVAIERGLKTQAAAAAHRLLAGGADGLSLADRFLIPALDRVGHGFEKGVLFLPQLLAAAAAAGAAFEEIKVSYGESVKSGPPVVLATVKGDIHDIGKNIVKTLLENYGFNVIDLGRDVSATVVVEAVLQSEAKLVGLSALMTTTLPAMEETIRVLRSSGSSCKVVVGGAVLTESYAAKIGADYYAADAKRTVDIAKALYGNADQGNA